MKFTSSAVISALFLVSGAAAFNPSVGPVRSHAAASSALFSTAEETAVTEEKKRSKKDDRLRMMKSDQFYRRGFKEVREDVMEDQFQSKLVDEMKTSNYVVERDGVKVHLAKVRFSFEDIKAETVAGDDTDCKIRRRVHAWMETRHKSRHMTCRKGRSEAVQVGVRWNSMRPSDRKIWACSLGISQCFSAIGTGYVYMMRFNPCICILWAYLLCTIQKSHTSIRHMPHQNLQDFGFCWGVERSIALAYEAVKHFPDKTVPMSSSTTPR